MAFLIILLWILAPVGLGWWLVETQSIQPLPAMAVAFSASELFRLLIALTLPPGGSRSRFLRSWAGDLPLRTIEIGLLAVSAFHLLGIAGWISNPATSDAFGIVWRNVTTSLPALGGVGSGTLAAALGTLVITLRLLRSRRKPIGATRLDQHNTV